MALKPLLRAAVILSLGLLAACVEMPGFEGQRFGQSRQTELPGAENGSRYASIMMGQDIRQIALTAWQAIETPSASARMSWASPISGAAGDVTAGPNYLVGFNAGEEIEAPINLDTRSYLAPAAGSFITHENSNVRLAPSLRGEKVIILEKGVELQAIAHEQAANWYLVAVKGRVIGYVFGDLVTRIEGGELLLAGGEPVQPKLCRELTYTLTTGAGEKDAWINGACKEAGRDWRIVGGRSLEVASY